jgi:predicted NACHT family NTPase
VRAVYEDANRSPTGNRPVAGGHRQSGASPPRPQESRLADTPLLVTIIAIVHYNQRRLPEQRAELYDKCVEVLLTESTHTASDATYELADWGGSLAEKRGLLANLAYEMMSAGEAAGRSVKRATVKTLATGATGPSS